jgi:GLPGLI family protein
MVTKLNAFIFMFIILSFNVLSQKSTIGTVLYKIGSYNPNKKLTEAAYGKELEELEYELIFNNNSSLYRLLDNVKYSDNFNYEIAIGIAGNNLYYTNYREKKHLEQYISYDPIVNVNDFGKYNWKITNESKKIGSYNCTKAYCHIENFSKSRNKILAFDPYVWFTNEIPVKFGPKGLDGLPGLVLEGTINGVLYFYATTIDLNSKLPESLIQINKNAKELTSEELEELSDKKFRRER